jgi:hypothetical protein
VGDECDFIVAVDTSAVDDPAVGAFDNPAARLGPEPIRGLGPRHDVDTDPDFGDRFGDGGVGQMES